MRVFSLVEDCSDLDAFSFWHDGRPFVLLNTQKSAERSRLDAAHELAHLVLHRHRQLASKEAEREAYEFAGQLLMPATAIKGMARRVVTLETLLELKAFWGASAAAVAFRLHAVGAISDWTYRQLFQQLSVRGWRRAEPNPEPREVSQAFAKIYDHLALEGVSRKDVARELQIPLRQLQGLTFGPAAVAQGRPEPHSHTLSTVSSPAPLTLVE